MKQTSFSRKIIGKRENQFGGSLLKGKRKTKRPLSFKKPMHLVLKAERRIASQARTFELKKLISGVSKNYGVKIYALGFGGNHIHFAIQVTSREQYTAFVRRLSAAIVKHFKIKWQYRPFTLIVTFGRQFQAIKSYLFKNTAEFFGVATLEFLDEMTFG